MSARTTGRGALSRASRRAGRRPRLGTVAVLAVFAACALLFSGLPLRHDARTLAGHGVLIVLPALAAFLLVRAARRAPREQRLSWAFFALGCAFAALGQLLLLLRTELLGWPETFPSPSFFLFLSFHPLFVAGVVLALQPRRSRGLAAEALLDVLLLLLTVGLVLIRLVILPLWEARPWLDPGLWILFGQLLMSVASVLFALLLVVWREPTLPPRSIIALIAAMAVNALTNVLLAEGVDPDPRHPGHWFSLLSVAGWLLIAWAGIEAARGRAPRAPRPWRRRVPTWLRRGSVPLVLLVLLGAATGFLPTAGAAPPETRVVLVLLTATLVARWFVALRATERGGEHQRALAHTRALVELGGALSTADELQGALDLVAGWAQRLLRARGAAVELSAGDGTATLLAATGTFAAARGRTRAESASFLAWLAGTGESVRTAADAAQVPAAAGLGVPPGIAVAAAPLRFGARTSGALVLILDTQTLDPAELELLGALGEQAAIAVENRRLADEGRQARRHHFQSEKLAMVGQLAGGVAHEINNPLAAIQSAAELLLQSPKAQGETVRLLSLVRSEARRAGVIVRNLLELVRPEAMRMEVLDVAEAIEDTLRLRAYAHGLNSIVVVREIERVPPVRADRARLRQALLNLLVNAEQAVADQAIRRVRVQLGVAGDHVEVTVADNGPGIAADKLDKLFEPFFTTRRVGEGAGLGLAVTYGIVRELGGTIRAANAPQGGAVFTIRLPAEAAFTAAPAPVEPPVEVAAPGGVVLLVDDEGAVREVTARALQRAGFTVDVACSGEAALELLRQGRFDVVLTDVNMPGLGGPGLYARLRELGVPLLDRFVFMSGDTLAEATRRFIEATGQPHLGKPFALQELVAVVARVARGTPARA